ncbi:MAG: glycoside hydrolase family 92 protein [Deltaproteobacteria bacterium]|nr:glycoside hydrolase family 92 protein [Deltaproteobacteria bacterium]
MPRFLPLIAILLVLLALPACAGDDDDDSSDDASSASDDDTDDDTADDDIADDDTTDDDIDDDTGDDDEFEPRKYVDVFVGTAGDHGQLHPAASAPFGMVKLGPDTLISRHSGYDFNSNRFSGFSHTRIGGVGCSGVGGHVRFLPTTDDDPDRYVAAQKDTEIGEPGYYAVTIDDEHPIDVELTASEHVGMHRYVFPTGDAARVLVTLDQPFSRHIAADWSVDGDRLEGSVSGTTVCNYGEYKFYFSARFDRPIASAEEIDEGKVLLKFDLGGATALQAKVALSTVDEATARADGEAEVTGWDFDEVRAETAAKWDAHLSRVRVDGNEELKGLFYTMLYRASMTPVGISGPSGKYRGTDGEVHSADGERYHAWSLWDTYRNKFALLFLVDPTRGRNVARSLVELYQQGKVAWANDHEPFPTVRTEHAAAILLDALEKGIGDFGIEDAFDEIVAEADALTAGNPGEVLENSYDDWAIAKIAAELGEDETADDFLERSQAYRQTWIDNFQVMGEDADILHARGLYEGTLWQYRWAVVHDVAGMVDLLGGREAFEAELAQFFDEELYNHGNEPDIHAPFLFNFVGAPWRTQDIVRQILVEEMPQWYGTHDKWNKPVVGRIYQPIPEAYIREMDDDAGTMSAWFALAAMGLYPVTIGQPVYQLTAPIFERVAIETVDEDGNAAEFVVFAPDVSSENRYIQSATLNGTVLNRAWLTHREIANGGELVFEMGPTPSKAWAALPADAPPGP